MNIAELCGLLERVMYDKIVPDDAKDNDMLLEWDWDSDTYWIKIGIPQEWIDNEEDE
tara:strand:- start:8 stop:178 length:171 start_codon:yes stop_codon:yes gene_type:complete